MPCTVGSATFFNTMHDSAHFVFINVWSWPFVLIKQQLPGNRTIFGLRRHMLCNTVPDVFYH